MCEFISSVMITWVLIFTVIFSAVYAGGVLALYLLDKKRRKRTNDK